MLAQTHKELEDHFHSLSKDRAPLGYPVYAFEHGLESEQVLAVRRELCEDLVRSGRLRHEHWLLWTVVAAEIGYTYDGDEYWYSFESEIPEWVSLGSREAVRGWFRDFRERFTGFRPTGRWAEHFSIIAWPITHSILPQYLQAQFAHHLYDLRHDLAATENAGVDELGHLLEESYHGVSSRFENFLQQTALTARLVLALRDEDVQDTVTPIFRPTLSRIVKDLEQKRSSRTYLRDARHVLRDARMRARGGLVGRSGSGTPNPSFPQTVTGIKLVARHAEDDSWTLGTAFPDFRALMRQTNTVPAGLDKVRFQFTDRPDGWMPGRALLSYSANARALTALSPNGHEPLIRFQQPAQDLDAWLPYMKLAANPPWLMRVHSDGIARQVMGNHVRAGETYLFATAVAVDPETVGNLGLREVVSRTSGVKLYTFGLPATISPTTIAALHSLSMGYALRARVKSFGLVPRWDEAASCSVWLVNEEILLHLTADFHITEFVLSMNGEAKTHLPTADKQELLVSLGLLPPGRYIVEISATAKKKAFGVNEARLVSPETLAIEVRPPRPWRSDAAARTGLRAVLQPSDGSFDDLLEQRATLTIHGPEGRSATVETRLYGAGGDMTTSTEIGRIELPSNDHAMATIVGKLTKEPLSERIQSAPRIDLSFSVEELGTVTVSFPHKIVPLRWKLATSHTGNTMRLVDETGAGSNVAVGRYDMPVPDRKFDVTQGAALQGIAVNAPGSLFVARYEGKVYAAFASVPPRGKLSDFSQILPPIALAVPGDAARNIVRLLAILRFWRIGKPLGTLAALRRNSVLGVIQNQIELLVCGSRWAAKAQSYRKKGGRLKELQLEVGGSPGFASRMRTTTWDWYADSGYARAEFYRLAKTYGVCLDRGICDLAMRLAFHPTIISLADPKQGAHNFQELGALPILARGAYFAKLTSDLRFQHQSVSTEAAE
jgi:hypothetical protein